MELSVITVTWNSAEYIARQINSVRASCQGIDYEHIVVDNASTDKTTQEAAAHPAVKSIKKQKNTGFAAANNAGYAASRGEFLLFLNPDMELRSAVRPALEWLRAHPQVAIAGGLLLDPAGQVNAAALPRRFPRWRDMLAVLLKLPHIFPRLTDRYLYRDQDGWQQPQAVDSVRGSCLLLRRSLADELGFAFDPRYFIWWEDVDLCREAQSRGYGVWHLPQLCAVDAVGRSFSRRSWLWKQAQFAASLHAYARKWEPPYVSSLVALASFPLRLLGKLSR